MILQKIKEFVKASREISNNNIKSGGVCSKFFYWVKAHLDDIVLLIGVILISLLSFAMGYIVAKQQTKEPIKIEKEIINKKYTNLDAIFM